MKRTWIILIISTIVFVIAFVFFVFPGYYFTLESKRAASTILPPTDTVSPPPTSSSSLPPSSSTGGPTPSFSGSSVPSYSQSGSVNPSVSASGSVGISPSNSGSSAGSAPGETDGGGIWDLIYGKEARQSKIESLSSTAAKPITGAAAAAIATALVISPLLSLALNSPFRDLLYFLFNFLLELLGIRKRSRPWGIIYDSLSKKPIRGAVVKVIKADSGRVKEMRATDNQGRFGFLVGKGKYHLTVAKSGYLFPSKKITLDDKGSDGYFAQVYLGGPFTLREGFLGKNIPLDLKDESLAPSSGYLLFLRFVRFFERIRLPLLIFGTLLALINLYLFRSILDLIIVLVYFALWLYEILTWRKVKPYGKVQDEDGTALSLAVVRLSRKSDDKLVATSITDNKGRFFVLLPEGDYYLTASKSGYFLSVLKNIHISKIKPREIKVLMRKSAKPD